MDPSIGDLNTTPPDRPSGGHAYALKPGEVLGQYLVIRVLGAGGMGEVYEVEHTTLDRRYALKLLPEALDWKGVSLERFRREAKVMANLDHPNILKVDEFGEAPLTGSGRVTGRYWLRMELVEGLRDETGNLKGVSLQDLAEGYGGKIPQEELLPILKQILEGLDYAHKHGAIHRDLKPSNILLSSLNTEHRTLNTIQAKISDFGLVRLVGEDWVRSQAQLSVQRSMSMGDQATLGGKPDSSEGPSTRALLGTYEYMSPEQKRGEDADERSDLYAVGLMAYRLLTGRNIGPKLPSRIDPSLAEGWDDFVEQALEEERTERLASASAALVILEVVEKQVTGAVAEADRRSRETVASRQRAEQECLALERKSQAEADAVWRRREEEKRNAMPPPAPAGQEAAKSGGRGWVWVTLLVAGVAGFLWFANRDMSSTVSTPAPSEVRETAAAPAPKGMTPQITITSPSGGETWHAGNSYTIKWKSQGVHGKAEVRMDYPGRSIRLGSVDVSNGTFTFSIPNSWPERSDWNAVVTVYGAVGGRDIWHTSPPLRIRR